MTGTADLHAEAGRLDAIRAREQAASPGPWEPGSVWLMAGVIWSETRENVGPKRGTRCGFCHLGEPIWSGRANINGTAMPAHRHRNPDPYEPDHLISAANGGIVAGNYGYEAGGIICREDTVFVAHARSDVPWLLDRLSDAQERLARIDAALDVLEGYGGPDTHDAYLQIRRASTATCERCGQHIPGPNDSGSWFCEPCEEKDNKRCNRIRIRRP